MNGVVIAIFNYPRVRPHCPVSTPYGTTLSEWNNVQVLGIEIISKPSLKSYEKSGLTLHPRQPPKLQVLEVNITVAA